MRLLAILVFVFVAINSPVEAQTQQSSPRYEFVASDKSDPTVVGIVFDRATGCLARVYRTERADRDGFVVDGKRIGQGDAVLELSFEPWACPRSITPKAATK